MRSHSARILAFPLARRRGLVRKLAEQMLARSPAEAEKHLAFELSRHRRLLGRKGLPEAIISEEISEFEAAVRNELWRVVMAPPQPRSGA